LEGADVQQEGHGDSQIQEQQQQNHQQQTLDQVQQVLTPQKPQQLEQQQKPLEPQPQSQQLEQQKPQQQLEQQLEQPLEQPQQPQQSSLQDHINLGKRIINMFLSPGDQSTLAKRFSRFLSYDGETSLSKETSVASKWESNYITAKSLEDMMSRMMILLSTGLGVYFLGMKTRWFQLHCDPLKPLVAQQTTIDEDAFDEERMRESAEFAAFKVSTLEKRATKTSGIREVRPAVPSSLLELSSLSTWHSENMLLHSPERTQLSGHVTAFCEHWPKIRFVMVALILVGIANLGASLFAMANVE
jgi:exonuclease VII large subunit